MTGKMRTGGEVLVATLKMHGVDTVFCVPGESYLAALDALIDSGIRVITCRHEGGAAFMAEAYGKLTGKPGVCFVTRGPGACNASIGLHTAKQDSTPFFLLIGQVARADRGREAFQEIDYRRMFANPIAKDAVEAETASGLAQLITDAFHTMRSGRPGPVAISLPEDVLTEETDAAIPPQLRLEKPAPSAQQMQTLVQLLQAAEKPLVIAGGNNWDDADIKALEGFCEKACLPVALSFRRQDIFDNTHPSYAGTLGTTVDAELLQAVKDSDLIIAIGTRLGDIMTQGYTLLTPPKVAVKLVHVYPEASELNKVYHADLAIHADMATFCAQLGDLDITPKPKTRMSTLHDRYLEWSSPRETEKFSPDLDLIMSQLIAAVPSDTIITTDAGNFSGWAQRFWRYRRPGRLLAPTAGAMGYAVPAAVAASLVQPEKTVIGFAGDGGFLMTAQEIATALQHGSHPILVVFDNGMYGTIRMHQEKHYPGRVSATDLKNPDFAALAHSYGAFGVTVSKTVDFAPALQQALQATSRDKVPAVIHVRMNPEQLTTGPTLSAIRATALAEKKT